MDILNALWGDVCELSLPGCFRVVMGNVPSCIKPDGLMSGLPPKASGYFLSGHSLNPT